MSVYTATCIVMWHISCRTDSVHVLIHGAQCTVHDIDQCNNSGVFYTKTLVIHGW